MLHNLRKSASVCESVCSRAVAMSGQVAQLEREKRDEVDFVLSFAFLSPILPFTLHDLTYAEAHMCS